ncbi:MAG TPA: hypothetical protein VNG13_03990 [Mycobacteriales bacterium]|nr:hypothetical protein [Mycobacteriales bacterium]
MSCEHLVCAQCAAPVVEGRCPSCRAARTNLHRHGIPLSTQAITLLALLLATFAALAALHLGG